MRPSTKDKAKANFLEMKGRVQEKVALWQGEVSDSFGGKHDPSCELEVKGSSATTTSPFVFALRHSTECHQSF